VIFKLKSNRTMSLTSLVPVSPWWPMVAGGPKFGSAGVTRRLRGTAEISGEMERACQVEHRSVS